MGTVNVLLPSEKTAAKLVSRAEMTQTLRLLCLAWPLFRDGMAICGVKYNAQSLLERVKSTVSWCFVRARVCLSALVV